MISILMVDDDKLFINRIKESLQWSEIGIDRVLTANSVEQAKKVIEMVPVDILLADIEMPQGNGLELLEWVCLNKYPIMCVFLSSYAQFSYAQKAIQLQSVNYLLKPISNRALSDELSKVVDMVLLKQCDEKPQNEQKEQSFWNNYILYGRNGYEFLQRGEKDGIFQPWKKAYLILLRIIPKGKNLLDANLSNFIVENATEELFQKTTAASLLSIIIKNAAEAYLVIDDCGNKKSEILPFLYDYVLELQNILKSRIYIYLANARYQDNLICSCKKLDNMLENVIPGKDPIIEEDDWNSTKQEYHEPPWNEWELGNLNKQTIAQTRDGIIEYIWQMWSRKEITPFSIRRIRSGFMQMIFSYFGHRGMAIGMVFETSEFDKYYEKAINTLPDMEELIQYAYDKMIGFGKQDNKDGSIVTQLKNYIQLHLGEDLSRKVLASVVYLSQDYISRLFSEATGESLPNYITNRRMEKAKEYLSTTDLSVSKIAMEVGFSNFSYFSKNFRNYAGCTPNEYRNRLKHNKIT